MSENGIAKLTAALINVQKQLKPVPKLADNSFFNSKYADLVAVWESVRQPLADNGLAIIQSSDVLPNGQAVLKTILAHTSGESVTGLYPLSPEKGGPQGLASCVTYARRYALCAMVGITSEEEDDDGNKATKRDTGKQQTRKDPGTPLPQRQWQTKAADGGPDYLDEPLGFSKGFSDWTWRELPDDEDGLGFLEWLAKQVDKKTGKPGKNTIRAQEVLAWAGETPPPPPATTDDGPPTPGDDDIPF